MKKYTELQMAFNDAKEYQNRSNKMMFNEIFVKDATLDKLIQPNIYFLIGDKGTGKTAYATYLKNNNYKNIKADVINIAETDYKIFFKLKKQHSLSLSDYNRIWRLIILVNFAKMISKDELDNFGLEKTRKFKELRDLVKKYTDNAFEPETEVAIKCIDNCINELGFNANICESSVGANNSCSKTFERETKNYQTSIFNLENQFMEAFKTIKLKKDVFLFFDNVDISDNEISLEEYLEILKGLAEAIIILNTAFNNFKDLKCTIKVVLLIRPDILTQLSIHNQANILEDNSILLDWKTTEQDYRNSKLFQLANRILEYDNHDNAFENKTAWDTYFPWNTKLNKKQNCEYYNSFIDFLRLSFLRPRDIVTILKKLQEIEKKQSSTDIFAHEKNFSSPALQNVMAEYYINDAKDWCLYRFNDKQFQTIKYFFEFLKGKYEFSYDEYCDAFQKYLDTIKKRGENKNIGILDDKEEFLQLLFDLNFIGYVDVDEKNKTFFRFSFKEKTFSNLNPRVKTAVNYKVNQTVARGLNIGSTLK